MVQTGLLCRAKLPSDRDVPLCCLASAGALDGIEEKLAPWTQSAGAGLWKQVGLVYTIVAQEEA